MTVAGLLLAAGAGRRFGMPKALVVLDGVAWLDHAVDALAAGGSDEVVIVLGAEAEAAEQRWLRSRQGLRDEAREAAVPVRIVRAQAWAEGMGASLRAGLAALETSTATGVLVHLVDLPDVGVQVVRRVLAATDRGPTALARATYHGRAGHPVLVGRDHWASLAAAAVGDEGGRQLLATGPTLLVECGDLATGADIDEMPGR